VDLNGANKGKEMSDIPNKSLLLDLENAVLAIEQSGFDENSIFAFVNMILKGFITNGSWTPEYLEAAAKALQEREQAMKSRTLDTLPFMVDANGNPLK
jgi:hypothetical protein